MRKKHILKCSSIFKRVMSPIAHPLMLKNASFNKLNALETGARFTRFVKTNRDSSISSSVFSKIALVVAATVSLQASALSVYEPDHLFTPAHTFTFDAQGPSFHEARDDARSHQDEPLHKHSKSNGIKNVKEYYSLQSPLTKPYALIPTVFHQTFVPDELYLDVDPNSVAASFTELTRPYSIKELTSMCSIDGSDFLLNSVLESKNIDPVKSNHNHDLTLDHLVSLLELQNSSTEADFAAAIKQEPDFGASRRAPENYTKVEDNGVDPLAHLAEELDLDHLEIALGMQEAAPVAAAVSLHLMHLAKAQITLQELERDAYVEATKELGQEIGHITAHDVGHILISKQSRLPHVFLKQYCHNEKTLRPISEIYVDSNLDALSEGLVQALVMGNELGIRQLTARYDAHYLKSHQHRQEFYEEALAMQRDEQSTTEQSPSADTKSIKVVAQEKAEAKSIINHEQEQALQSEAAQATEIAQAEVDSLSEDVAGSLIDAHAALDKSQKVDSVIRASAPNFKRNDDVSNHSNDKLASLADNKEQLIEMIRQDLEENNNLLVAKKPEVAMKSAQERYEYLEHAQHRTENIVENNNQLHHEQIDAVSAANGGQGIGKFVGDATNNAFMAQLQNQLRKQAQDEALQNSAQSKELLSKSEVSKANTASEQSASSEHDKLEHKDELLTNSDVKGVLFNGNGLEVSAPIDHEHIFVESDMGDLLSAVSIDGIITIGECNICSNDGNKVVELDKEHKEEFVAQINRDNPEDTYASFVQQKRAKALKEAGDKLMNNEELNKNSEQLEQYLSHEFDHDDMMDNVGVVTQDESNVGTFYQEHGSYIEHSQRLLSQKYNVKCGLLIVGTDDDEYHAYNHEEAQKQAKARDVYVPSGKAAQHSFSEFYFLKHHLPNNQNVVQSILDQA